MADHPDLPDRRGKHRAPEPPVEPPSEETGRPATRSISGYLSRLRGIGALATVLAVAIAAAAIVVVIAVGNSSGSPASPADHERAGGRQVPGADVVGFGFTQGVDHTDPNLPEFRSAVDEMAAYGQSWIRIGIPSWVVSAGGDIHGIRWDDRGLSQYDKAFQYARSKGLKIYLTSSGAPDWAQNFSFSDYLAVSTQYWSFLAQRYKNDIAVWQVFNEADASDYRRFVRLDSLNAGYLDQLKTLIRAAATVIHRQNPLIKVTTNASGYPMNDRTQQHWYQFFDALAPVLDEVTVDVYPDTNTQEINKLGRRLIELRNRSGKQVAVGEIGLPTCQGCFSEDDQRIYMSQAIGSLKQGAPTAILYYSFRDDPNDGTSSDIGFGIELHDGTHKKSFAAIMAAMR